MAVLGGISRIVRGGMTLTKTPAWFHQGFDECYAVGAPIKGVSTDIGDFRWKEAHAELLNLHLEKSSTYGTKHDQLANFTQAAEILGKPDEYPVLVRMLDKISRAAHMIEQGKADQVKEWPDLASLALCAEALRRRRRIR